MRNERPLLFLLAFLKFTHIMDFMIMMPLGPQLMRVFGISPAEFGLLVSSYTVSAGIAGLFAALLLDRFDRKKALMVLFSGFTVGTLFCAISPGYEMLLISRIFTGAFGGILAAQVLAIVGDVVPQERRGQAMGIVMAAFSAASIFGVPFGLFLANHFGWQSPFLFIGLAGIPLLLAIWKLAPSMTAHMDRREGKYTPFEVFGAVAGSGNLQRAILLMGVLMLGQFTVITFISPYMVGNVGFSEGQLALIYLIGGGITLFSSPAAGWLSDKFGKARVLSWIAVLSVVPLLLVTHLPASPLHVALLVTTLFFLLVSSRGIPTTALITSAAPPNLRAGFMSLVTAIQQLSSGISAYIAGVIVVKTPSGALLHYDKVGYIAVAATLLLIPLAYSIRPAVERARVMPDVQPEGEALVAPVR